MSENIYKEFTNQIIELKNGWIETQHGIFTPNDEQDLSAYEVYENYLYNLNNPPIQKPTLEERVQLQEDKINILTEENETLKQELALTQDAVNEMLFMMMNMEVK